MTLIPSIEAQIRALFPDAPLRMPISRELWQDRVFSVYLRNSAKSLGGHLYHSIVIAKVELTPDLHGRGYYRELCTFAESFATAHPFIQVIVHECVLNPDLAEMHLRHGYVEIPQFEGSPASDFIKWAKPTPITLVEQTDALRRGI
jgi:hypothetical protein